MVLVDMVDLDDGVALVASDDGVDSADSDHTDLASLATESVDGRIHWATGTPSVLDSLVVAADLASHSAVFTIAKLPHSIVNKPRNARLAPNDFPISMTS